ncbi:MAG: hypothetical protein GVY12_01950 [Bacteroidetes bacterium]|jgi:hypothetical protein|nr:hypothetical protein [Bacteroidota bacterium]
MAKYTVDCTSGISGDCAGTFRVQLYGKRKDREWKLENYDWTCDACKAEKRRRKNQASAEANAERGLPGLEGSDKQIGWAETIRARKVEELDDLEQQARSQLTDVEEDRERDLLRMLVARIDEVRHETDAGWWIDYRDRRLTRLLTSDVQRAYDRGERPAERVASFVRTRLGEHETDDPTEIPHEALMDLCDDWADEAGIDRQEAMDQVNEALFLQT